MTDTSLAMQAAVIAALKNAAAVETIVGERIYDRVPDNAALPYVNYGDDQVLQDDIDAGDCLQEGFEVFVTLHAWSNKVGQVEAKNLGGAIRAALHNAALTVSDHRLITFEHDSTRYLRDPDGLTSHGVLTFRALLDAA